MAMNLNDLKNKLNQLNRKTSKGDDVWKPRDEHQVRLIADPRHQDDPLIAVFFHNDIGENQPIVCPKMNSGGEEECAVCDFADKLKAWKDPDGNDKPEAIRKQDFNVFKKIQAKPRMFVPMIERGRDGKPDSEKAMWWGLTKAQADQVLEVCDGDRVAESGFGDEALRVLFDTKKGYDLMVSYAKPGDKGNTTDFTQITIKGKIRSSPLAKDEATAKRLSESVRDLKEIYPPVSSAEVERILKKFVGSNSEEAKPTDGLKYENKTKQTNSGENAKLSGTRSLDEAFGDMAK